MAPEQASIGWGHRFAAWGLLLACAVGSILLIDQGLLAQLRADEDTLAQQHTRLTQLERKVALRAALERDLAQLRQDQALSAQYLKPSTPALAAAELQQRIKSVVESAGGTLQSTQVLSPTEEAPLTKVAVNASLTVEVEGLKKTLHALESQSPLLFIDNLQLQAREYRPRMAGQRLAPFTRTQLQVQCEISGYLYKETP